ncbi:hypothetical protein HH303_09025 [Rhodospirillaceae bacterium KN72]|uniref:Uncharacterized protein n=1 Tax=Pacificispira spongiicola TaxID=2729598 RepID=A0A7Y0DZT7_9PROT|nr:hypothetical protein [Pacificispira spongiicola]NMM44622.1 hypothetical protein [Pacificispira spongiicola]
MFSADLNFIVARDSDPTKIPADAMSRKMPVSLDFQEAMTLGGFTKAHETVMAMADDGVVDWSRFDITSFAYWMPAIATLDRIETEAGEPDFVYRFVGESINTIAKRSLRGISLRQVLVGPAMNWILTEYETTLKEGHPRASTGQVTISDMNWVRYLRFLYPVRTATGVDRILLFMLYDTSLPA